MAVTPVSTVPIPRGAARALLVVLVASACAAPPATSVSSAAPAPERRVPAPTDDGGADFITELSALAAPLGGTTGVWVAPAGSAAPWFALEPDRPVIAASLYKLGVLLEVERRVDAGDLAYDDRLEITDADVGPDGSNEYPGTVLSVHEALEQMITYSDNGAALAFVRTLGSDRINATLDKLGFSGLHVARDEDDDHTVTPRALGSLFAAMAERRLLSPAASDRMLARLQRQTVNDRLPVLLPPGTAVAHKTGDVIGYTHDAGIVFAGSQPVIVVVLTEDVSAEDARALIAEVAARAHARGLVLAAAAPSPPVPLEAVEAAVVNAVSGAGWPVAAAAAGAVVLLAYVLARLRLRRGRSPHRAARRSPRSMAERAGRRGR